jgi:hypothetical protein
MVLERGFNCIYTCRLHCTDAPFFPFTPTAHPHPFHGADYRASHPRLTPARGP